MKLTLILLIVVCAFFIGCGSKAPSGEQIEAALNSAVKKENAEASAKLTDIEMASDGKETKFKFNCTNCMVEDGTRTKKVVSSAKGRGTVWRDPQDGKWKFYGANIINEDGTEHVISFGSHTF